MADSVSDIEFAKLKTQLGRDPLSQAETISDLRRALWQVGVTAPELKTQTDLEIIDLDKKGGGSSKTLNDKRRTVRGGNTSGNEKKSLADLSVTYFSEPVSGGGSEPAPPLVTDNFNRADNVSSLGSTPGGLPWTAAKGTWGIIGNQAYNSGGTADSIATLDAGAADVAVEAKFNVRDDGTGVIVRYQGVNAYYIAVSNGTSTTLYKKDGVSFHNLAGTGTGAAAGDVIRLEALGTRLRVFRNGVLILQATDPSFTGTVAGLRADTNATRFDDFAVYTASAKTFSSGFQSYRDIVLADTPRFFVHGYDSEDYSGNNFHALHKGSFPLGRVSPPAFIANDGIEGVHFRGDNWLEVNDATRQITDLTWECIFRTPHAATGEATGAQGFFSDGIFNNGMAPGVFNVGTPGGIWFGNDRANIWMGVGTNQAFNDNLWHHLVMVWDGTSGTGITPSQFKIYVDGSLIAVTQSSYAGNTPPLSVNVVTLGYRRGGGQANFIGNMCMWSAYDKALTATDVTNRWNAIQAAGGLASAEVPLTVPGLNGWYKTDSFSLADGAEISSGWPDSSGSARSMSVTGTAGETPKLYNNVVNGHAAVRFDGNDALNPPTASGWTAGTAFIVFKKASGTQNDMRAIWRYGTSGSATHFTESGNIQDDFGSNTRKNHGVAPDMTAAFKLYTALSAPNDYRTYFNGVLYYSTTTNTVSFNSSPTFARSQGNSWNLVGDVVEFLTYKRALTNTERQAVENYLMTKYGLS